MNSISSSVVLDRQKTSYVRRIIDWSSDVCSSDLRLGRAADRAFGERVTAAILKKGTDTLVEAIKRPVTIAVMDEVTSVLQTGHYTAKIARALNENRSEFDALVVDLFKRDKQLGRLKFLPFHDEVVRWDSDTVFRLLLEVVNDTRTE